MNHQLFGSYVVFARALKTDIKRTLAILIVPAILILLAACFISNSAFAQTGMDIPVEISWSDQSAATRPSGVTLRLMNGNTTVSTLTLTSANLDPSDSNKWVGVFDDVPYNANYTIVEDSVSGYSITSNNLSPSISAVTILESAYDTNTYTQTGTTHNLGDVNFIVVRTSNNYYVWTLDDYPSGTKRNELTSAVRAMVGNNNATISAYYSGIPETMTMTYIFIAGVQTSVSGSEGNVSIRHYRGLFGGSITGIYYGNLVPGTTDGVSFENVRIIPTYKLTVHHLKEDNTQLAADVETTYNEGDTYTATPISNNRYTPELTIGQATGTITQDTEVTYVYHPNFHTVSYVFTGSVLPPNADGLLHAPQEYDDGSTVTVAPEPTAPQGYRFLGWQMNGQSISGTFTMPSQDVTITGSWEQFNGYFAPAISKQITNVQNDPYRFGDTVEFQITVTNTANFPITNVHVKEKLLGANFVADSDYTLSSDTEAVIASIPANGSVILIAEYEISDDVTETRANTVEITSASTSNYYFLDPNEDYTASVQFATQSWQDVPVLTGVKTNGTILYFVLMFLGAIGIGGSIVAHQVNIKEREK
ncbi:MAG: Cna B-type domain-containing protein [Candidatus Saccharibacteria bacterium]|nr:Cna B-type domain-containing protein [Candidatus Saccharibacteria bacterium]